MSHLALLRFVLLVPPTVFALSARFGGPSRVGAAAPAPSVFATEA